jgi:hypothetical protein
VEDLSEGRRESNPTGETRARVGVAPRGWRSRVCPVAVAAPAAEVSSHAQGEMTALLEVDTKCTTPSLIPTVDGNTVRSFSTHGQQPAAKGSLTVVSRSDIRLIQSLDSSAHGLVRSSEVALNWPFPYPTLPPTRLPPAHLQVHHGSPLQVRTRSPLQVRARR